MSETLIACFIARLSNSVLSSLTTSSSFALLFFNVVTIDYTFNADITSYQFNRNALNYIDENWYTFVFSESLYGINELIDYIKYQFKRVPIAEFTIPNHFNDNLNSQGRVICISKHHIASKYLAKTLKKHGFPEFISQLKSYLTKRSPQTTT